MRWGIRGNLYGKKTKQKQTNEPKNSFPDDIKEMQIKYYIP